MHPLVLMAPKLAESFGALCMPTLSSRRGRPRRRRRAKVMLSITVLAIVGSGFPISQADARWIEDPVHVNCKDPNACTVA